MVTAERVHPNTILDATSIPRSRLRISILKTDEIFLADPIDIEPRWEYFVCRVVVPFVAHSAPRLFSLGKSFFLNPLV
jgi:hypothetical protein